MTLLLYAALWLLLNAPLWFVKFDGGVKWAHHQCPLYLDASPVELRVEGKLVHTWPKSEALREVEQADKRVMERELLDAVYTGTLPLADYLAFVNEPDLLTAMENLNNRLRS